MTASSDQLQPIPAPKGFLGVRHLQLVTLFLGLVATFMNRINLSEGLVGMTQPANESQVPTISLTITQKGELSGAFFWGYALTAVPGGMLAIRFGPVKTLAVSFTFCGIFNCLTPIIGLKLGFYGLYVIRIFEGLAQGPIYPSVHTHMAKWAVPRERGVLFAITYGGGQIGTIFMMVISGFLSESAAGWPLIFYVSGACGIAWAALCLAFLADSPADHKMISIEERIYIESNFKGSSHDSKLMDIPWTRIMLSGPAWAIVIAHLFYNWGFWSLISLTPTYLQGVYKFNLEENGFLSALPYLAMFVLTVIFSPITDYVIRNNTVSTTVLRKIMNSIAFWIAGLMLLVLGLAVDDATDSIVCLILASGSFGAVYTGFLCNHIDLSPNFSGLLMGLTNGLSNIASILGPTIAGIIVVDESSQDQWQVFFVISAAILIVGNALYLFLASGEIQPWNEGEISEKSSRQKRIPHV